MYTFQMCTPFNASYGFEFLPSIGFQMINLPSDDVIGCLSKVGSFTHKIQVSLWSALARKSGGQDQSTYKFQCFHGSNTLITSQSAYAARLCITLAIYSKGLDDRSVN